MELHLSKSIVNLIVTSSSTYTTLYLSRPRLLAIETQYDDYYNIIGEHHQYSFEKCEKMSHHVQGSTC